MLGLTQHREVGAPGDRGHAGASQHGFALIEAGVADCGIGDGEPAIVVADATGERSPVLLPHNVQLDQRPTRRRRQSLSVKGFWKNHVDGDGASVGRNRDGVGIGMASSLSVEWGLWVVMNASRGECS